MYRKIGMLAAALVVILGGGLLFARAQGTIIPGVSATPIAQAIEGPLASGDSTVVADFARRRCRLLQGTQHRQCYEEILLALVERGQVRLAMTSLEVLSDRDPGIRARGHDYTHVVGINAWQPGKDVSAIYEQCTALFQSGCYHGVVQAYLDANGADSANVANLCDIINVTRTNLWLRFQCVHGLGHGLVQARQLHLRQALEGCDWLFDDWDEESCYGGAFMEFIVAGRGQSHHPHSRHQPAAADSGGGHAEHGDHGGHEAHGDEPAAPPDTFAIRNPADPLYPCSVLDFKYQRSCYGMQAGIIIEQTGADFGKIAAACDGAPATMRPACYQGIGTYVSGFTVRDPARSIDLCMMGNPEHRAWCFVGVVKNFIDVTSNPVDGFDFCRRLEDEALGVSCLVAVGEQMAVLKTPLPERERLCAPPGGILTQACRYGAGLGADRPPGLPAFAPRAE